MLKITGMKRHIAMITMLLPGLLANAQGKDALVSEDTTNMTATIVRQGTNLNVTAKGFLKNTKVIQADQSVIEKTSQAKKVLKELVVPKNISKGPQTLEEAADFISKNVGMACPPTKCFENEGFFYFSGGTSVKPVDNFNSGLAIKKGEATIYEWTTDKPDEGKSK